jgi:hypothetical protein
VPEFEIDETTKRHAAFSICDREPSQDRRLDSTASWVREAQKQATRFGAM